jgi:hypothetical protein
MSASINSNTIEFQLESLAIKNGTPFPYSSAARADKLELVKAQLLVHFRQMPKCLQLSAKIDCADSEC